MSKHGKWIARCGDMSFVVSGQWMIDTMTNRRHEVEGHGPDAISIGIWMFTRCTP